MNVVDEQGYRSRLMKAAAALESLEAEVARLKRQQSEPVAVIGMGCRFPGADDPESFWSLLSDGVDAVTEQPDRATDDATKTGAFLSDVDGFDAAFFGISPSEAAAMDPQHRLLLEVAWEALEDAGVATERLAGTNTGVFAGMSSNDYLLLSTRSGSVGGYAGTGTAHSFGAGRLSYLLGLRGPSLAVDTACSSSLVAVHLAIRSLRTGESSLALAGGVNLVLDESVTHMVADLQALSPDGRCRTFDARANGFVRGEGCGIVVLKRLSDAAADGDRVLAVLRGSSMNSDGHSAGLTAPNPLAQQEMLRQAFADARVHPDDIGYVETHGTGTALGDPMEIEALTEVFGEPALGGSSCALGAVKTNIGHLEAAAGIAGLIKAVLALRNAEIPRNLHFRTLNPRISLTGTPFVIPQSSVAWPAGERPRIAGVSSFGMSGTNAHVVVAEAPAPEQVPPPAGPAVLALSARSREALTELASAHASVLERHDDPHDIAYTAGVRRDQHQWRTAVVGTSSTELAEKLRAFARDGAATARADAPPALTFVFSGQGPQWVGMGQQLQANEPVFAATLAQCDELIEKSASFSLLAELAAPQDRSRLQHTEIAQPALFALQVALSALLSSWGVRPDAVVGHSAGEIAAAYVAGALSLAEAIRIVVSRGRIMARAASSGTMVAVELTRDEVATILSATDTSVAVAAINDDTSVVLSGTAAELHTVLGPLQRQGVRCHWLSVDYPFHSPSMAPLAAELAEELGTVDAGRTACPLYSTVRGERIDGHELTGDYWADNVRHPVRFAEAVHAAGSDGQQVFLEIAPHPVLSGHVANCRGASAAIPTLRRERSERHNLLDSVANLYTAGYRVDFAALYQDRRPVVSLPRYPWQRNHYWLATEAPPLEPATVEPVHWLAEMIGLPDDERMAAIESAVRTDTATVLQLSSPAEVPVDGTFMELGMDSLMTVQLRHELVARTGLELPATLAFDHPTPQSIIRHLLEILTEHAENEPC